LQSLCGRLAGLILASLAFTLWHFFPQLEGTMTSSLPLSSPLGILSIALAGLLFGYIYQRTENILAPWVAHTLGGVGLVLIGRMVFIQAVP
jgi:membrane protease YdiL (CAAX protease family)